MAGSAKTPPRFVPTLTDVVHLPSDGRSMAATAVRGPAIAQEEASPALQPATPVRHAARAEPLPGDFEEYLVHRVMQRVDVALDQRLRDAITHVVQEQTRFLVPRLREELESVLRHAVYEAVAQELADGGDGP